MSIDYLTPLLFQQKSFYTFFYSDIKHFPMSQHSQTSFPKKASSSIILHLLILTITLGSSYFGLQMGKENLREFKNTVSLFRQEMQNLNSGKPDSKCRVFQLLGPLFSFLTLNKGMESVGSTSFSYLYIIILKCSLCEISWHFMI